MVDKVSYKGGFLWSYFVDGSRQFGEIEARKTMAWTQGKGGTPAMGQIFLDAYHATGDEYYYQAALKVADALIWGQLECGGWNYCFDFAGEASLIDWYKAIRQYNWPAQEYLHYYGNATFDDMSSIRCCEFLYRIYHEKLDSRLKPAVDKAIDFVLKSQYPIGGWPQRYPLRNEHTFMGFADYSSFITLNDGAMEGIIDFLMVCYRTSGDQKLLEPLFRGMYCMLLLQQETPNAGWGLQYTPRDLKLATARPFEPAALASAGSANAIESMMNYYCFTGDRRFLERVPAAFDFLESVKLSDEQAAISGKKMTKGDILCPTFIEPDTHNAIFLRRKGASLWTGGYERTDVMKGAKQSYSSVRVVHLQQLKDRYEQLKAAPVSEVVANSALYTGFTNELPKYTTATLQHVSADSVKAVLARFTDSRYWPGEISNQAIHVINLDANRPAGAMEKAGVDLPATCISTEAYVQNAKILIGYLSRQESR